jgi:glycosyltransferase involved in cell wall biosynthesis
MPLQPDLAERAIRVCAVVPYPVDTTPSQRFRIEQWRPHLQRVGIDVEIQPFASQALLARLYSRGRGVSKVASMAAALVRRLASARSWRDFDVILVHRTASLVGPALVEHAASILGKPLVYDFDDAIFLLHTTAANRRFGWLKFPGKTAAICRLADHVVVGNEFLADYARQFNTQVSIVPTSIELNEYVPVPRERPGDRRVIIGWTGSSTSQTHLETFAPTLRRLAETHAFELRVMSDREPLLPGMPVRWQRWTPDVSAEVREIGAFDIGIMPMPDDVWSKGKCALKALQYMAMGVPTVATAVGANREVIAHGVNGMLAASEDEWLRSLKALIDDPSERTRLGSAGRRTVEERYSARYSAGLLAAVIRGVLARREANEMMSA